MADDSPQQFVQVGRPERIDPLVLDESERDLLVQELAAISQAVPADRRGPYEAALEQAAGGTIAPPQVALVERVLEMALSSGRVKHAHRAEGERILQAVFKRTPRGKAIDEELAQVNKALAVLVGQPITSIRASSRIPGHQALIIKTDTLELSLEIDPGGTHVKSASL